MSAERVAYAALDSRGRRRLVRGQRVGRFAVRFVPVAERYTGGCPFLIDHIPSGTVLTEWPDQAGALFIADELARFAEHDPDTREPYPLSPDLFRQLGHEVMAWLTCVQSEGAELIGFREWRAKHQERPS